MPDPRYLCPHCRYPVSRTPPDGAVLSSCSSCGWTIAEQCPTCAGGGGEWSGTYVLGMLTQSWKPCPTCGGIGIRVVNEPEIAL